MAKLLHTRFGIFPSCICPAPCENAMVHSSWCPSPVWRVCWKLNPWAFPPLFDLISVRHSNHPQTPRCETTNEKVKKSVTWRRRRYRWSAISSRLFFGMLVDRIGMRKYPAPLATGIVWYGTNFTSSLGDDAQRIAWNPLPELRHYIRPPLSQRGWPENVVEYCA